MCEVCHDNGCGKCEPDWDYMCYNPFDEDEKNLEELKTNGLKMMKEFIKSKKLDSMGETAMLYNCLGMIEADQRRIYVIKDCEFLYKEMREFQDFHSAEGRKGCDCDFSGLPPGSTCKYCGTTCCAYCNDMVIFKSHSCPDMQEMVDNAFKQFDTVAK